MIGVLFIIASALSACDDDSARRPADARPSRSEADASSPSSRRDARAGPDASPALKTERDEFKPPLVAARDAIDCDDATIPRETIERIRELGAIIDGINVLMKIADGAKRLNAIYQLTHRFTRVPELKEIFEKIAKDLEKRAVKLLLGKLEAVAATKRWWREMPTLADDLERALRSGDEHSIKSTTRRAVEHVTPAKIALTFLFGAVRATNGRVEWRDAIDDYKQSIDRDITRLNAVGTCGLRDTDDLGDEASQSDDEIGVRRVRGRIEDYSCGDNCYLTITMTSGVSLTGLCAAPLCDELGELDDLPARYMRREVTVRIETGEQYNGAGEVEGEMDAFVEIELR